MCSVVPEHTVITSRNLCNYIGISNVECIESSNKICCFVYSGASWKLLNLGESIVDKSCCYEIVDFMKLETLDLHSDNKHVSIYVSYWLNRVL